MIVVSNTSPLNYLVLIRAEDVLPELFGEVLVPESVAAELANPKAPKPVRDWIAFPPGWIEIANPKVVDLSIPLHTGERDALCLAKERGADLILLDEKAARRIAREQNLSVAGTVGVLEAAANRKLIDLPTAIAALRQTSYQISEEVLEAVLKKHQQEKNREQGP